MTWSNLLMERKRTNPWFHTFQWRISPRNFGHLKVDRTAEDKEKDGILEFQTWRRLNQATVTPDMRKKALRAHHLYGIKRDGSAKDRVVANGSRQHPDTYSDTTSPVSSQLLATQTTTCHHCTPAIQHSPNGPNECIPSRTNPRCCSHRYPWGISWSGRNCVIRKRSIWHKTRITKILRSHRHGVQNHWVHTLPQWALSVPLRSSHRRSIHHLVRWWCLDHGKKSNCQDSSGKDQRTLQVNSTPHKTFLA